MISSIFFGFSSLAWLMTIFRVFRASRYSSWSWSFPPYGDDAGCGSMNPGHDYRLHGGPLTSEIASRPTSVKFNDLATAHRGKTGNPLRRVSLTGALGPEELKSDIRVIRECLNIYQDIGCGVEVPSTKTYPDASHRIKLSPLQADEEDLYVT